MFKSILKDMSVRFNQNQLHEADSSVDVGLSDDKTLKWRTLHNNRFAASRRVNISDEQNNSNIIMKTLTKTKDLETTEIRNVFRSNHNDCSDIKEEPLSEKEEGFRKNQNIQVLEASVSGLIRIQTYNKHKDITMENDEISVRRSHRLKIKQEQKVTNPKKINLADGFSIMTANDKKSKKRGRPKGSIRKRHIVQIIPEMLDNNSVIIKSSQREEPADKTIIVCSGGERPRRNRKPTVKILESDEYEVKTIIRPAKSTISATVTSRDFASGVKNNDSNQAMIGRLSDYAEHSTSSSISQPIEQNNRPFSNMNSHFENTGSLGQINTNNNPNFKQLFDYLGIQMRSNALNNNQLLSVTNASQFTSEHLENRTQSNLSNSALRGSSTLQNSNNLDNLNQITLSKSENLSAQSGNARDSRLISSNEEIIGQYNVQQPNSNNIVTANTVNSATKESRKSRHFHLNCFEVLNRDRSTSPPIYNCTCSKHSVILRNANLLPVKCGGIDVENNLKYGCNNTIVSQYAYLFNASKNVPFMIICDDHKLRAANHTCCPECGEFCVKGNFIKCSKNHIAHLKCTQRNFDRYDALYKLKRPDGFICLHCGISVTGETTNIRCTTNNQKYLLPPYILPYTMDQTSPILNQNASTSSPNLLTSIDNEFSETVANIIAQGTADRHLTFEAHTFLKAIREHDIETLAEMIAAKYDIVSEYQQYKFFPFLHLSISFGSPLASFLILNNYSCYINEVNEFQQTCLMSCVKLNKVEQLDIFLQFKPDVTLKTIGGLTCLHMAAEHGRLRCVMSLIEYSKFTLSASRFIAFINEKTDNQRTALTLAISNRHTDVASYLLQNGAEVNYLDEQHNSLLHYAASMNLSDLISFLLMKNPNSDIQNLDGDTPLHIACRKSNEQIAIQLILHGCNIRQVNKANEIPYDCLTNENSICAKYIAFHMQMDKEAPIFMRNIVLIGDISKGREEQPISVSFKVLRGMSINRLLESDWAHMSSFRYIKKSIIVSKSISAFTEESIRACHCNDSCASETSCTCSSLSVKHWYTTAGHLASNFNFVNPPSIYECNDACGCNKASCANQVVQKGIKNLLQIFKCDQELKGWGVRTLSPIIKGAFIAEYTGEILCDSEADKRTNDTYMFELGDGISIDSNKYGNVSRFFNHSCRPNIVPVRVFYGHSINLIPKTAFFACCDISENEELVFDYGAKFWSVKKKLFACTCEAPNCRYPMSRPSSTPF